MHNLHNNKIDLSSTFVPPAQALHPLDRQVESAKKAEQSIITSVNLNR